MRGKPPAGGAVSGMKNIEFKAELRDLEAARRQCALIGAERIGHLRQKDEYFRLAHGRLKRRTAPGEPVEWIRYERDNRVTPRASEYDILSEQQARRRWGTHSLRPWLTVLKTRELWMLDGMRIHLDEVDELGVFIEFEAMVSPGFDEAACRRAVDELRETFGPLLGEPVAVSYSDLLDLRASDPS
ncbi:MAG: class IV adenylate cyclase [Planctomycetota bacterium]|jgi:adenylate cyclase class IV